MRVLLLDEKKKVNVIIGQNRDCPHHCRRSARLDFDRKKKVYKKVRHHHAIDSSAEGVEA
jgi:hypothetical protein